LPFEIWYRDIDSQLEEGVLRNKKAGLLTLPCSLTIEYGFSFFEEYTKFQLRQDQAIKDYWLEASIISQLKRWEISSEFACPFSPHGYAF